MGDGANGYRVRIAEAPDGWRVAIEDPGGIVVMERACADAPRRGRSPPPSGSTSTGSRRAPSGSTTGSEGDDVGFNAMQPGKIKRGDVVMLVIAVVVVLALIVWAAR